MPRVPAEPLRREKSLPQDPAAPSISPHRPVFTSSPSVLHVPAGGQKSPVCLARESSRNSSGFLFTSVTSLCVHR